MHAVRLQPRSEFRQCSCVWLAQWVGGPQCCIHVCGWSVCVWSVVAQDGKVYACGEATNGQLGLGLSSGSVAVCGWLSGWVVHSVVYTCVCVCVCVVCSDTGWQGVCVR